jgi:hypothetical protein
MANPRLHRSTSAAVSDFDYLYSPANWIKQRTLFILVSFNSMANENGENHLGPRNKSMLDTLQVLAAGEFDET